MINREVIQQTLEELKNLYNSASENEVENSKILIFYSKLAILELCGWIEETQDEIVMNYVQTKLQRDNTITEFKKDIVGKIYGFHYSNQYFRKMLIHTIGIVGLEKLEAQLEEDEGSLSRIKSILGTINTQRNEAAHKHLTETTPRYSAPSVTCNNFLIIYNLLQKLETVLYTL
jgi:hypothetical protein